LRSSPPGSKFVAELDGSIHRYLRLATVDEREYDEAQDVLPTRTGDWERELR
jgi:hypothetical protein